MLHCSQICHSLPVSVLSGLRVKINEGLILSLLTKQPVDVIRISNIYASDNNQINARSHYHNYFIQYQVIIQPHLGRFSS